MRIILIIVEQYAAEIINEYGNRNPQEVYNLTLMLSLISIPEIGGLIAGRSVGKIIKLRALRCRALNPF